jgi:hypothetical protein
MFQQFDSYQQTIGKANQDIQYDYVIAIFLQGIKKVKKLTRGN